MDHLSMHAALLGRYSQSWMPGTLVPMALNCPRYSLGASGLGSHVSCGAGPPRIQRMMTELGRFAPPVAAPDADWGWSRLESVSPAHPSTPAWRNLGGRRSASSENRGGRCGA